MKKRYENSKGNKHFTTKTKNLKRKERKKKKEKKKMIDHNTVLYILYIVLVLGGLLALGYHLFAGEEEE